ncbi:MAG: alpha-L-rhamnosidase N-terminal domain-containing protein, partial [Phycisphaerae bacterium]|nr:alpha-L-rhamnosidase N-terminal domain-containing protein [Phycisphaerae bacterium]
MKRFVVICILLILASPAFAATATLSVFTEDLRPVFLDGEVVDIIVVLKTSVAFEGGAGKLLLAEKGAKKARAVSFKVPKMGPGKHVEVFRIDTATWKPAKYYFLARLGDLKSNSYDVEIVGRERPTNFGIPDIGFWQAGPQAYRAARYKVFGKANVNLVISAGTDSPNPLAEPPKLAANTHWAQAERKQVEFRQQWSEDLTKPAYEIHPERRRTEYALANDGALRNRVSTGNKPFIIDDRTWMGVISFRDTVYQYGKRVLYYSANHRRYPNYLGVLFNDDPNMYWSPATSDCPARWPHLAPIGGRDFKSPGNLEPVKKLHDGRLIFKGQVLDIGNVPKNMYWRKWIDIPFQPKEVKIELYKADVAWFWINGKRQGYLPFKPGWSWRTFDITDMTKKGRNLIAVEGYNIGWIGYMAATIRATDPKGKHHYWYTNTTWKMKDPEINDIHGHKLDGVPEAVDWAQPKYDDSEWKNARPFTYGGSKDGKLVNTSVGALWPQADLSVSRSKRGSYCWDWTADFSQFYRLASDAMYKVDSGMRHTTNQGLYWGPGCGEYTPSQYRALDYGVSILYTDQGEYPMSDSFDAERFQRGMKPGTYAWVGMANFSERNNVWLRGIRVAGRKVGGVGFFCGGGGIHSLRGWQTNSGPVADWEGRRFSMETLLIALQSYGDLFVGLKEDDKVAWLSTW